jgi:hypothetical protein
MEVGRGLHGSSALNGLGSKNYVELSVGDNDERRQQDKRDGRSEQNATPAVDRGIGFGIGTQVLLHDKLLPKRQRSGHVVDGDGAT